MPTAGRQDICPATERSDVTQRGTCPECESEIAAEGLQEGETLVCPECMLTLQVLALKDHQLEFEAVATTLPDWGE